MTYTPILPNPIEFNDKETEKCTLCHNDLTSEEITEQDDDNKFCDNKNTKLQTSKKFAK